MKKRLGIAILAGWLLVGCGSSSKEEQKPEPTTIELVVWGPEPVSSDLQEKTNAFIGEHSSEDLQIVIEPEAAETIRDTVLSNVSAAADVILLPSEEAEVLNDAQALLQFEDGSYYRQFAGKAGEEELVVAITAETSEPEWAKHLAEAFGK